MNTKERTKILRLLDQLLEIGVINSEQDAFYPVQSSLDKELGRVISKLDIKDRMNLAANMLAMSLMVKEAAEADGEIETKH